MKPVCVNRVALLFWSLLWLSICDVTFGQTAMLPGATQSDPALLSSETATSANSGQTETPDATKIRELLRLLGDQRVNHWLQRQLDQPTGTVAEAPQQSFREMGNRQRDRVRQQVSDVAMAMAALPQLPNELSTHWSARLSPEESLRNVIYVIIFLFIGFAMEWLYWNYATARLRQLEYSKASGLAASARRASVAGLLRLAGASVFSAGCICTYLFFDWSEVAGQVVLSVLFIVVSLRLILVLARVIFSPASDHMRMVPLDKSQARRAVRWIAGLSAVALMARVAAETFGQMGVSVSAAIAVQFIASLIVSLAVILAIWCWLVPPGPIASNRYGRQLMYSLLVLVVLALDTIGADASKWILLVVLLLIPAIGLSRKLVDYYFDRALDERRGVAQGALNQTVVSVDESKVRSPVPDLAVPVVSDDTVIAESAALPVDVATVGLVGHSGVLAVGATHAAEDNSEFAAEESTYATFDVYRPVTQRLVRFCIIVATVLLFFAAIGIPLWSLYSASSAAGKSVSAAIDIAAVLLMADLLWVWTKTVIDRRLADFEQPAHGQMPGPGARMATLLPLVRKVILVLITVTVVLVILSSLGVNIAPLLAGAGVLGIAVGFGAQALVKDVVSGVFFLFEDAFRVGEYIEVGDLRGTVEAISVRSFRVRHHLGAVHTIPYGELSSLTNHSRDWAIVKMQFRVPFETDLKLVKKIVKKIGAELQNNEVYGHYILEPLKSQGVRRMEEFNMVVGVKFMSAPGQQWTIRRDAYQAIRDAFDKNGLSFAERSVKVEVVGDAQNNREAIAAAAQDAVETQLDAPVVADDTP